MYFLLTRPEEDSRRLARQLESLGHSALCAPLLTIENIPAPDIDLSPFQAVLFTSANGVRAFAHYTEYRQIPCYAVGPATAAEARAIGFSSVITAGGDVEKLVALVVNDLKPEQGPLLHISGRDVAGDLSGRLEKAGFTVSRKKLYTAIKAKKLSPTAQDLITSGQITHVVFYSPRTAKCFVEIIERAALKDFLSGITALCLSSAVSNVISTLDWHRTITAQRPEQEALFKLIDITLGSVDN
ncbi:Uroporphyrinogen-III synthase [hydrothermal vent metagenome]|uniref:uroporphyrinogen-III synthase n=1 Tax=hydrothermal vent metagenome TaxID=652676 RepID=A0A3B0RYH8_9ZZZZ